MRYGKTRDGDIFFSSTGRNERFMENLIEEIIIFVKFFILAVFMAELTKLLVCMVLVFMEEGTLLRFKASLHNAIVKNKTDTVSKRSHLIKQSQH